MNHEAWLYEYNVEAVACFIPDFDQVCRGIHIVRALGNDGMGVDITVDNEIMLRYGEAQADFAELAFLGRGLTYARYQETVVASPEYR